MMDPSIVQAVSRMSHKRFISGDLYAKRTYSQFNICSINCQGRFMLWFTVRSRYSDYDILFIRTNKP